MKPPSIVLKDVTKTYATSGGVTTEALRSIALTIPAGQFVAIMGPSGSGKSSLMHIIGLLDTGFTGEYHFGEHDVTRLSKSKATELRSHKIGFVFQQFNLLKRTTVLHNVLLPTVYHRRHDDVARAVSIVRSVGLVDKLESKSNQLSGGQVQRVAIARALIMNPAIILADEPTGNLDSKTAHEIMTLLKKIHAQGKTIIVITHEDDIAAYAERRIHLKDGRIEHDTHL